MKTGKTGGKIAIVGIIGAFVAALSYYFLIYKPKHPPQDNNNAGGNTNNNSGNSGNAGGHTGTSATNTNTTTSNNSRVGLNTETGTSAPLPTSLIGRTVKAKNNLTGFYEFLHTWFSSEIGDVVNTYSKNQMIGNVIGMDSEGANFYKIVTSSGVTGWVQKDSVIPL